MNHDVFMLTVRMLLGRRRTLLLLLFAALPILLAVVFRLSATDGFSAFVAAAAQGGRIVAAGRVPPVDLPVREDLRTRLAWGLVFALQPLAEPELVAALRREASRRGLALPDELVQHLLTRFARDLASLMRMLERLDRYAMARARRPTVPLLRAMLADEDGAW